MERVASDAQHHTRAESTTGLGEDAEGLKSECVEKLKFNFARFPCGEVYDLFDRSMSMELHKFIAEKGGKFVPHRRHGNRRFSSEKIFPVALRRDGMLRTFRPNPSRFRDMMLAHDCLLA